MKDEENKNVENQNQENQPVSKGKMLGANDLLKGDTLKKEPVIVDDDTGDFVYVRQMTARERDNLEASLTKEIRNKNGEVVRRDQDTSDFRAKIIVRTVCDEQGNNFFSDEHIKFISANWTAEKAERIARVAMRLNKITQEDREELEKNSEGGQAANSSSNSAEN